MIAWFCVPSAAPIGQANACFKVWRSLGYGVAIIGEDEARAWRLDVDFRLFQADYVGYAAAVNRLVEAVLLRDSACQWLVTGGDDVYPDPGYQADELAAELTAHFGSTLGVMQPYGGDLSWSANAQRIAWSPWLGREWCSRAYQGQGPLCPLYYHGWADLELRLVAEREGVFWARPDLIHRHETWKARIPRLLRPTHLRHTVPAIPIDEALFKQRQVSSFPGSALLV